MNVARLHAAYQAVQLPEQIAPAKELAQAQAQAAPARSGDDPVDHTDDGISDPTNTLFNAAEVCRDYPINVCLVGMADRHGNFYWRSNLRSGMEVLGFAQMLHGKISIAMHGGD
jgi:hypothetical protein